MIFSISFALARFPGSLSRSQSNEDLVSGVGTELEVGVDRWSTGQIGLADVVVAGAVLAVAVVGAWIVRRIFDRMASRLDGPAATASLIGGQVVSVAIYLFAAAIVLEIMGFSLGPVVVLVTVVVVGLLLLQPVIWNLSAGLLLQLRSPFRPGDVVETNEVLGTVEEVNTRTVVLATSDGRTVHLPNRKVLDEMVVNYSDLGRRRSELTLRLAAGVDVDDVTDRLQEALVDVGYVLQNPPPTIVVTGFDGCQLCLQMLFWHRPELSAERVARDRVARATAAVVGAPNFLLADPAIIVRSPGPANNASQSR
ncbi:MAG: mechanosensitive ion channel family protein [Acidimicrobiales bacterium]